MLSGGPLDVEGQAACRMAYATFLRHGGEAHDATLLYHYHSLPPYFCSFVKMILFIAEKDKEKKAHRPCARHELAVIVKEVKSVNNRTIEKKASESPRSEL